MDYSELEEKMIEIGRLCIKIAGRDANKKCVIVDILNDKFVLIDGETRRKRVNINHLEPVNQVVLIKKGASHTEIFEALKKIHISVRETNPKPKTVKPLRKRKESKN